MRQLGMKFAVKASLAERQAVPTMRQASQITATDAPEPGDIAGSDPSSSGAASEHEGGGRGRKRKSDEISRDARIAQPEPLQDSADVRANAQTDETHGCTNGDASTTLRTQEERSMSPRGRTRGMSLRSSLFSKNMQRRTTTDNAVIELQTVPSAGDGAEEPPRFEKDAGSSATFVASPSPEKLAKATTLVSLVRRSRQSGSSNTKLSGAQSKESEATAPCPTCVERIRCCSQVRPSHQGHTALKGR